MYVQCNFYIPSTISWTKIRCTSVLQKYLGIKPTVQQNSLARINPGLLTNQNINYTKNKFILYFLYMKVRHQEELYSRVISGQRNCYASKDWGSSQVCAEHSWGEHLSIYCCCYAKDAKSETTSTLTFHVNFYKLHRCLKRRHCLVQNVQVWN